MTSGCFLRIETGAKRPMADLNEAIRLDFQFAMAYYVRGVVYYKKGDQDKAIADYSKAIRLDPKLGDAYYSRGNPYGKKGDSTKAIADPPR